MTNTPEMQAEEGNFTKQPLVTPSEFADRVAQAREDYAKFQSHFDYKGAAEAYRNMLFDTLLRRITILSGSEFGCAGEILSGSSGPYLKIFEAGFIHPQRATAASRFWEENFGTKAELHHLDNPLGLDLKTPRTVLTNGPAPPGPYLAVPVLSEDGFVGFVIVAGAAGGYTQESVESIRPVADVFSGVIEYLRAGAEEKNASAAKEVPAVVFNCNNDDGRSINYICGQTRLITGYCESAFTGPAHAITQA